MASVVAPPPVFQALAIRFVVKFVAVVRIRSLENIKRATKLGKVTVNKFHDLAEKWTKCDHKFNKRLESVDWSTTANIFCCKPYHSLFYKVTVSPRKRSQTMIFQVQMHQ